MTDTDSSLDYSVKEHTHPTLHFRNVAPQTSGNVPLSAASTSGPTSFIISSSVFNPRKSRLNFELQLPAGTATEINFVQSNLLKMISRITMYDQNTSAILADINNVGNTYSILNPIATKFDEFVHKSQPLTPGVSEATARVIPYEEMGKILGAGNQLGAGTVASVDTGAQNPYFQLRNVIGGTAGSATVIQCSIPFSAFKHSFFDLDRQIYSSSNLQLDVYWAGFSTFAWKGTNASNLSADQAAVASATLTGSQMLVQLCTEGNVGLASQVIQTTMSSGMSLPIGYVSSAKFVIGASTSQSWTIPLTAAYGKKILYTAFAPFNNIETLSLSNNHSRNGLTIGTSVITSYNTFINSTPILAAGGFEVANRGDDFTIANKQYIEGSVLQNVYDYTYNWVHVDNYARTKICELDPSHVDGLDVVSQQANYQLQATTTSTALNWYLAIIGQKTLNISSQGVSVN
jgi:hypothetical protein